ncbi:MAG TPA: DUF2721 domain-containing protein [Thermoanaerobaculia bacterium]|nr:DUF2721 domain-containing protein [Thermoanaerobaculia bacterium]
MTPPTIAQLLPVLQIAIGPVILISGIGLLLLSMTNRYARTIDRARELSYARHHPDGEKDRDRIEQQIEILWRRSQILRRAIFFGTLSVLWAAILIITLFITELLQVEAGWLLGLIFIACLASLIVSLIDSIRDVNVSLVAVRLEIER